MASSFSFRLGAPSYVFPADVLPNVVRLGPHVDDIEILLFEVASPEDLPDRETIDTLRELADEHRLSYTVHIPLDLVLASADDAARLAALRTATDVIEATRRLDPWAYVIHVQTDRDAPIPVGALDSWRGRAIGSLERLIEAVDDPRTLAVENLTGCPPAAVASLLDRVPVSLCLDVGHVLKTGGDPLPVLRKHAPRLRVVHLHGVTDGSDHRGLAQMDPGRLRALAAWLEDSAFGGVVTVEVFAERAFFESLETLRAVLEGR